MMNLLCQGKHHDAKLMHLPGDATDGKAAAEAKLTESQIWNEPLNVEVQPEPERHQHPLSHQHFFVQV
jgi:hypothetical protein